VRIKVGVYFGGMEEEKNWRVNDEKME
jgi:hypothetical protein